MLRKVSFLGQQAVEKFRVEKKYRNCALDRSIRIGRTKREARLLARAKEAGALCPIVYQVDGFSIRMKFLRGKMLYHELRKRRITACEIADAAEMLVKLHCADVVHGDYTPANLMNTPEGMAVIDFGLGSISNDDEDKATDVVMMKKSLGADGTEFLRAYCKKGGKPSIIRMVSEIEKRARYMERG